MSLYTRVALLLKLCYIALQVYYMSPVKTQTEIDIPFSPHVTRTIIFLLDHTILNSKTTVLSQKDNDHDF